MESDKAEYKVFTPDQTVTTIRASGEPPGSGAPLIHDDTGIWSCKLQARGRYNDFTEQEINHMLQHMTPSEASSAVGSCLPRKMFAPIAQALAKVLQRFLVPTKMQAVLHKKSISGGAAIDPAPAEGVVAILTAPDLALRGGVSAASKVKPHTIA